MSALSILAPQGLAGEVERTNPILIGRHAR
jgi:hypothetical protein